MRKPASACALLALSTLALALLAPPAHAAAPRAGAKPETKREAGPKSPFSAETLAGLELRSIGPALTSGRISDLVVDPTDAKRWFVAAASGGVWRTENAGTTWTPIFDGEGSYSIGCLALEPGNPNVLWVGTGENNSQRSVGYGDGVYLSLDGGKSFKKVGLEKSEHVGRILIDPRDPKVVYVAAQGPLWSAGGDRGLYKTTDRGATWKRILHVSDDTGISEVLFDPRDPDVLYASAYQRRRHVWTLVNGGPESAIYKSTDAGATWRKLEQGLPKTDLGRIGLAVSPVDPDVVYALVEAERGEGGFFRSADRGESWEKRGSYGSTSPQYYQELFADPRQLDRVYSMDTYLQVTDDGGKTWRTLGNKSRHVDDHAMWIDPRDTDHYLVGGDGGLYESFDRGVTWRFFENLPITQFYRVAVDETWPTYHVYGGTQDNNTLGGPNRTLRHQGPVNADWFITQGGDGFFSQIDPNDPNIVYSEAQHGALTRYDRRSGENVDIQPQPGAGEAPYRWNWDSPLLLSPHSPTRLYFAANKLFRSDDRGDSWTVVSPDLTRQLDRNRLKVFGRIQKPDAVALHASTSLYGNIVALDESPRVAGLLYVGTDDGLVQVSENGGGDWRSTERFPGVPDRTYVSKLLASRHADDVVYAAFDNHKMGDFKPFVLKSSDRGRTWSSITSDLPARGTVYALAEDSVAPGLLFAGTEFGLYVTVDGGGAWLELTGGLPTIQVRDLAVQRREGDLVVATFGRGFYVLDDVSPLRAVSKAALEQASLSFPVAKASLYVPTSLIGARDKGFLGETYYTGENPPFGATLTYYLKEGWTSKKEARQKAEKEAIEGGKEVAFPPLEELRAEAREEKAKVVATVADADGEVVRRIEGPAGAGIHRIAWDLRYPPSDPAGTESAPDDWTPPPAGPLAAPGRYTVRYELVTDAGRTPVGEPQSFDVEALGNATLAAADRDALLAFQTKVARLQRAVLGAERLVGELEERLGLVRKAIALAPAADPALDGRARALQLELDRLSIALSGDRFLRRRQENTPPAISERVQGIVYGSWWATAAPTATQVAAYRIAGEAFAVELAALGKLATGDLAALERELELAGAPWSPGRLPEWELEP